MKKYLSEINEENLSIEWEWESGGRLWITYDSQEEFDEALNSADQIEEINDDRDDNMFLDYDDDTNDSIDDRDDPEERYFRNCVTYSERNQITPDEEW